MDENAKVSLEAALQAQSALRAKAGLGPELFPIAEFVGMISDEIEQLRRQGISDDEIAKTISANSPIQITGQVVTRHYAPPEARGQRPE